MFNLDDLDLAIKDNETEDEYVIRICGLKEKKGLYWDEIANILNKALDYNYTESRYRKIYAAYKKGIVDAIEGEPNEEVNELIQKRIELQKEKVKLSDERIQANAYIRQLAREETIKEIASQFAKDMNDKKILRGVQPSYSREANAAILQLSDIHYGMVVDNYWNKYNPDIAADKIAQLRDKVIKHCEFHGVTDLYVTELGDAVAGRIHETIKLQSRFDVITQVMEISEIIAELLTEFSKHFRVHYYCCLDNHSRLEPNKKNALDLESLARIIPWYLKERVGSFIEINDNKYGEDIITFRCKGFNIAGCHGDKDSPIKVVDNLSMMTRENYDMILTAHLHHFSADEKNFTLVISNPSILSTDDYAKHLRLSSKSAQNLIIVSDENVMECLYRIVLN